MVDGVDQTIFQAFGYDPPGYQGYDKAMDVYYLAIAYLATLRNWTSLAGVPVAQFLYFYRLVGRRRVRAHPVAPLLLIFPNTFEYFFIAYEAVRLRAWTRPATACGSGSSIAAAIWVFVKLPQEWWIHVAQLDFTDSSPCIRALGPTIAHPPGRGCGGVLVADPAAALGSRTGHCASRPTRCPAAGGHLAAARRLARRARPAGVHRDRSRRCAWWG